MAWHGGRDRRVLTLQMISPAPCLGVGRWVRFGSDGFLR